MSYKPKLKISIQNAAGLYYYATKNPDNTWTVATDASIRYIQVLPDGWDKTPLKMVRNMTYGGVFRAEAEAMRFTADARAILLSILFGGGGVNAYAKITVYKYDDDTFTYNTFFFAEADFSACKDDKQTMFITVPLLESRAVELLKAKSNSNFNIPYWVESGGTWSTNDTDYLRMNRLKLLWRRDFIGAETASAPITYQTGGFNLGEHGTLANSGAHTLFYLGNFTKVQNNGATTYIGNDILDDYIDNGEQSSIFNEINFLDNGNAYQSGRFVYKTKLIGQEMNFRLQVKIDGDITCTPGLPTDVVLSFVLFELDVFGEPPQSTPGFYDVYHVFHSYTFSGTAPYTPPSSGVIDVTDLITVNPNKAYVVGVIFDGDGYGIQYTGGNFAQYDISNIQLTIESNYNSGTSTPVTAPALPITYIPSFGSYTLWQKLIQAIDSTETDPYGFPVVVGDFTGVSTYLSTDNDPADDYGLAADKLMFTSENAVRNINGVQYLTISPSEFVKTLQNIDGCGMGIEGDNFRIEKMEYFFDAATEIINLGTTVKGFSIEPMSNEMYNNIRAGYKAPVTNNLFGVDEFILPVEYTTPSNKTPKAEDMTVSSPIVGQYEIEKMRAQVPLNTVSSPSAGNSIVLLQRDTTTSPSRAVTAPDGTTETVTPYFLLTFATAQSTDPTAATDPYVNGMYYPETARNLGLQPARNIFRNGKIIRSIFDQLDSEKLSYRRQYQQNYANPIDPLEMPGINTNIFGTTANATADIDISSLDAKIFRPWLFKVTAAYPESMFTLIQANPYGYISFTWSGVQYKGFISSVTQYGGDNEPTLFELIAHPDTTDAQLKA